MSRVSQQDPPLSSLIFPTASLSAPLHAIDSRTKPHHIISNRLSSIVEDAKFVRKVAARHALPVLANERCGSWYVPLDLKQGSVYFKSTDGHFGQWGFSLRRLNLGVLDLIGNAHGCIVVDSTRRGKHMPDALTKTIPIWCAVLNRLLFPDQHATHRLHTPEDLVSGSECSQIESSMNMFAIQAKELDLDIESLRSRLCRPIFPIWVSQSLKRTHDISLPGYDSQYNYMVLCMPSKLQHAEQKLNENYVQGAGDDSESWALGMSPELFWRNCQRLMETAEQDLPGTIRVFVEESNKANRGYHPRNIIPGSNIYVGTIPSLAIKFEKNDSMIICAEHEPEEIEDGIKQRSLWLKCRPGKLGSKDLRKQLIHLRGFVSRQWPWDQLYVCCHTGKDLSVGVALVLGCLFLNTEGKFEAKPIDRDYNKEFIRKMLGKMMSLFPDANPSRTTLNAVNDFLMTRPRNTGTN